jgi:ADP-heptose:LPS heptosyltransferase
VEIGSALFSPLFLADVEFPPDDALLEFLRRFDLVVSWMGPEDAPFARNIRRAGTARLIAAEAHPAPGSHLHAADYLLATLADLDVAADGEPLRLRLPAQSREDGERLLAGRGVDATRALLAVHPGSGGLRKCWPTDRFISAAAAFGRRPGMSVAWLLGPAELEHPERFRTGLPAEFIVVSSPPPMILAALLRRSSVYLGNDSGVTHLAAAVGTRTLALFGPTDPELWAPRGKHVEVVRRTDLTKLSERTVLNRLARLADRQEEEAV